MTIKKSFGLHAITDKYPKEGSKPRFESKEDSDLVEYAILRLKISHLYSKKWEFYKTDSFWIHYSESTDTKRSPNALKNRIVDIMKNPSVYGLLQYQQDFLKMIEGCKGTKTPTETKTTKNFLYATEKMIRFLMGVEQKYGSILAWMQVTQFHQKSFEYHSENFFRNLTKNRNRNCPLLDSTRVKLVKNDKLYINASHISIEGSDKKWIVSQHPMKEQYKDFYELLFQEKIDYIFSISAPDEQMPEYFPTGKGEILNHGRLKSVCVESEQYGSAQKRKYLVDLLKTGTDKTRRITIVHCYNWTQGFLTYSARNLLKNMSPMNPSDRKKRSLVHSTEGINRAMAFVLIDYTIEDVSNGKFDLKSLISQLVRQRGLCPSEQKFRNLLDVCCVGIHIVARGNEETGASQQDCSTDVHGIKRRTWNIRGRMTNRQR